MTKRIGVTGGRDYNQSLTVAKALWSQLSGDDIIVEGGARGADAQAFGFSRLFNISVETHKADWAKFAKGAGFIRNQAMVDSGLDVVVAFPGGRGTADMVRRARLAGVPVVEVE